MGPPHNGSSSCGYVAVGPGMEQAVAFSLQHVDCATARLVAMGSRDHVNANRALAYRAAGFACAGSVTSSESLVHYVCRSGARRVAFEIR